MGHYKLYIQGMIRVSSLVWIDCGVTAGFRLCRNITREHEIARFSYMHACMHCNTHLSNPNSSELMSSGGSKRNDGSTPTSAHNLLPCKASKMMINILDKRLIYITLIPLLLPSSAKLFVRRRLSFLSYKRKSNRKKEKEIYSSCVMFHCSRTALALPKPWNVSTMSIGKTSSRSRSF
jgi:hypothetical protein